MITHFYSDPHFGHARILELESRPFSSVAEMDEALIQRYNEKVGPADVVLWLGDCFFCPKERACEIMRRLNGEKMLVRGNHDSGKSAMISRGFSVVAESLHVRVGGATWLCIHDPKQAHKLDLVIHGHTHAHLLSFRRVHAGVDTNDFRPISSQDVAEMFLLKHSSSCSTRQVFRATGTNED